MANTHPPQFCRGVGPFVGVRPSGADGFAEYLCACGVEWTREVLPNDPVEQDILAEIAEWRERLHAGDAREGEPGRRQGGPGV